MTAAEPPEPPAGPVVPGFPTGPRGQAIAQRLEELESALARGRDRIPPEVHREVRRTLDTVAERLVLGVDTTVVALAGGTGSGKSSLVNAISGLQFAEVGVRRPTTAQVGACTWGDATPLLDWLGVPADRRIERESVLDADTQADLRGLVLLDLPDHDSVEPEHRAVVDRLLPMVDLLVWVVDPQKYADDVLHSDYLRRLSGHEGAMVVVLNQYDTVPPGQQDALRDDLARLLREDGLDGVPVHAVSALTGEGVPGLRETLAGAVRGRSQAETAATAELADATRLVRSAVGASEVRNLPRDHTVGELLDAAGVPGATDVVRRGQPLASAGELVPQLARVGQVLHDWVGGTTAGLPDRWRRAVEAGLVGAETLRDDVAAALARVTDPAPRPEREAARRRAATWLAGLGVLAVIAAVVLWAVLDLALGAAVAGGAAVLALAGAWWARRAAARAHREELDRRAEAVAQTARDAVGGVVDSRLVAPTRAVLTDHRAVRAVVTAESSTAEGTDRSSAD